MGNRFASGKRSIAMCDRCGQQFKLKRLKEEVINEAIDRVIDGERVEELLIAEGTEAKNASKNQVEFFVDFADEKRVFIKKNGRADFKNLDKIYLFCA